MWLVLVFLLIGSYSADASCDTGGFQTLSVTYWSQREDWGNNYQAYVSWDGALPHYLGIKGSYIAQQEGDHWFRVICHAFGGSRQPDFWYDCEHQSGTITSTATYWEGGPYTFHPYFRYRICARYAEDNSRYSSTLALEIVIGVQSSTIMSSANGGRACEESGCADMTLSRDVWSCRPNPPSPTISPTAVPTPTETRSQSPSCTTSVSPIPSPVFHPFPHSRRGTIVRGHIFHFMCMSLQVAHY
jgi:hypothetical protein